MPGWREKVPQGLDPYQVLAKREDGRPLTPIELVQIFASYGYSGTVEHQERLAIRLVDNFDVDATIVRSFITVDEAKETFELWCAGRGISLQEDRDFIGRIPQLFRDEKDLIEQLGPHLKQVDLARILVLRRYRYASEETRETLVYGTYHLLGEVLGPRRYYRHQQEFSTPLPLPSLPDELFEDETIFNILWESERDAVIPVFSRGYEEGLKYLDQLRSNSHNPMKREFVDQSQQYMEEVINFRISGFKNEIKGSYRDLDDQSQQKKFPFPALHQLEFAYRIYQKRERGELPVVILRGDPATMKTAAAASASEALGCETTMVVCPSGVKDDWVGELNEIYEEQPEILVIDSRKQLRELALSPVVERPRYIVIGYSLLSILEDAQGDSDLRRLVERYQVDSLIVDEVHMAKEPTAFCTQQIFNISSMLPEEALRIAMTATLVINGTEDVDDPVRILFPYRYTNHGDFTRAARNDPHLIAALLRGEKILVTWEADRILQNELPPISHEDVAVTLSPVHRLFYDFVYMDDTLDSQRKHDVISQLLLDPLLVRHHYKPELIQEHIDTLRQQWRGEEDELKREELAAKIEALEERLTNVNNLADPNRVVEELEEAFAVYLEWRDTQDPKAVFDEDFLETVGFGHLVLWASFTQRNGMLTLVEQVSGNAQAHWQGKELYSSKYEYVKEALTEILADGKTKVMLVSGRFKTGVTTIYDETDGLELVLNQSLYDCLRNWFGDETVLKIDGDVNLNAKPGELSERAQVKHAWRFDPNKKILLVTSRASRLGINLTIPDIEANKDIERTVIVHLDPPDTDEAIRQVNGRLRRPGQIIPVEARYLIATNPEQPENLRYGWDAGKYEALEYKHLVAQIIESAIPLTEEQELFVERHLRRVRMRQYPETPQMYLNNSFFKSVRQGGYKGNRIFLSQHGYEGLTNEEFFAAYYPQFDELGIAGHTAKVVSQVVEGVVGKNSQVCSVGIGAGILPLTLGRPVVGIDMMRQMLEVARDRQEVAGNKFYQANATYLPFPSAVFDATEASHMLHWLSDQPVIRQNGEIISERALAIKGLSRITKPGGLVAIAVPYSYLDNGSFYHWSQVLEEDFGLRLRQDVSSGLVKAVDYRSEEVCWLFNLEKIVESQTGKIRPLRFRFEEVVKVIEATARRRGNSQDTPIPVRTPLPHNEFVILPPIGDAQQIYYHQPLRDEEFASIRYDIQPRFTSEAEVLVQERTQEYGLYHRLKNKIRSRWEVDSSQASLVALEILSRWANEGKERFDVHRIWAELQRYLYELEQEGSND